MMLRMLSGMNSAYFAPQADEDLVTLSFPEFLSAQAAGQQDYSSLMAGLNREAIAHPQMPKFYDTPELRELIAHQPKAGCEGFFSFLGQ
jgi:hypothetical protein